MPRRFVYLPDPPPQAKSRSSFVRSGPARDGAPPPAISARSVNGPAPDAAATVAVQEQSQPPVHRPNPRPAGAVEVIPIAPQAGAPKKEHSAPPPPPRSEVPRWIMQVRDLDLMEIAEVLGLEVEDHRIHPCPRCGDEAGAEVYQTKKGWTVWRCKACSTWERGNLDLASYALAGEKAGDLPDEDKALLQQWFADQGWCDPVEEEVDDASVG